MQQEFISEHVSDDQGRPAGGETYMDIGTPGEEGHWRALYLKWQNGPLREQGTPTETAAEPNGIFVETVIATAVDRLEYYQQSGFACEENAAALANLNEALAWLHARTARRTEQGVEGTHGPDAPADDGSGGQANHTDTTGVPWNMPDTGQSALFPQEIQAG